MSHRHPTTIIITLFILTFSTLTVPNMLTQNLIGDEAVYITEGDRYLHEPYSFYYNSGSPHLLKSLTALFYYTLPLNRNYQPYYDQNYTNVYTVAQFIYDQNTPYATQIIRRARIPHILLALITGILIFLYTQKYTQTKTAVIALALYTFHPSILAHASTANLDSGTKTCIFLAIMTYFHTIQKNNIHTPSNTQTKAKLEKNTITQITQRKQQNSPKTTATHQIAKTTQSRYDSVCQTINTAPQIEASAMTNTSNTQNTNTTAATTQPDKKQSTKHKTSWLILAGICIGLAQLTKISAILVYPFIFITGAIYLKKNKLSIPITITTISIATIITLYGFQTGPIITPRDDPAGIESLYGAIPIINQYKNTITDTLRMPIFPAGAYLNNFTYQFTHSFYGHTIYLNGIFTDQGLWYFIPVLFIYKNPIILLIALAITIVIFFKHKRYKHPFIAYLTIWCIIMALWSVTSKLQLGIRYILPIFPALFIISADALTQATKSTLKLSLIIAVYALSTLSIYPNYFTYTQELLRFQNPLNLIADSDYDWGQSVYKLAHVQKQKNLYPLYFTQAGGASKAYYKIQSQKNAEAAFIEKQNGYYAFSHSALVGFKKSNPPLFNYFASKKPDYTIDNTIYVYKVTF